MSSESKQGLMIGETSHEGNGDAIRVFDVVRAEGQV
jgi:hypothetical protein